MVASLAKGRRSVPQLLADVGVKADHVHVPALASPAAAPCCAAAPGCWRTALLRASCGLHSSVRTGVAAWLCARVGLQMRGGLNPTGSLDGGACQPEPER